MSQMYRTTSFTQGSQWSQMTADDCNSFDYTPSDPEPKICSSPLRKRRAGRMRTESTESDVGLFQTMLSQESMVGCSQMEWSQQESMSERLGTLSFRTSDDGDSLLGGYTGGSVPLSRATSFSERFGGDGHAVPLPKPSDGGGVASRLGGAAAGGRTSVDHTRESMDSSIRNSGTGCDLSFLQRVVESAESSGAFKENVNSTSTPFSGNCNTSHSSSSSRTGKQQQQQSGAAAVDTERQVLIGAPLRNPFLDEPERKSKRPLTVWVGPYKERPRYVSDFEQEGTLGEGSQAVVYRARRRLDGFCYAVKKLTAPIRGERGGHLVAREACALAALQGCPHILRYYGCWVEDSHFWIQTELCMSVTLENFVGEGSGGGGMHDYDQYVMGHVPANQEAAVMDAESRSDSESSREEAAGAVTLPEPAMWRVLRVMCDALAYMHRRGIAHLDVRPANILLRDPEGYVIAALKAAAGSGSGSARLQATVDGIVQGHVDPCLGDFGMCCRLDESLILEGADTYMAPELLDSNGNSALDLTKCDVFSLGATLYELCRGTRLADSGGENNAEWHALRSGRYDEALLRRISPTLAQIIRACLHPDPNRYTSSHTTYHIPHHIAPHNPHF